MNSLILKNCTISDANHPEPREGKHILIENEWIKEIEDQPIKSNSADSIDLKGKTVIPGLIDAHCHIILSDLNISNTDSIPPTLATAMSTKLMREMLFRGFTSIRDAAGADWGLKSAQEQGFILGPKLWIAGRSLSQTGGHGDFRKRTQAYPEPCGCSSGAALTSRIADGLSEVRHAARDELRLGANQIKAMVSGGVASPHDPIWNIQYSSEELKAIVEEAHHWNTYVMAHAYSPEAISHALNCGVRTIEHANLIDAETARLAVEKEAYIKSLEICKSSGVKIGFGTDLLGPLHYQQLNEFEVRSEALNAFEIFESATKTNAEILGMKGKLGEVSTGAYADLLVLEGNPLENIGTLKENSFEMIIQNGKVIKNMITHERNLT